MLTLTCLNCPVPDGWYGFCRYRMIRVRHPDKGYLTRGASAGDWRRAKGIGGVSTE